MNNLLIGLVVVVVVVVFFMLGGGKNKSFKLPKVINDNIVLCGAVIIGLLFLLNRNGKLVEGGPGDDEKRRKLARAAARGRARGSTPEPTCISSGKGMPAGFNDYVLSTLGVPDIRYPNCGTFRRNSHCEGAVVCTGDQQTDGSCNSPGGEEFVNQDDCVNAGGTWTLKTCDQEGVEFPGGAGGNRYNKFTKQMTSDIYVGDARYEINEPYCMLTEKASGVKCLKNTEYQTMSHNAALNYIYSDANEGAEGGHAGPKNWTVQNLIDSGNALTNCTGLDKDACENPTAPTPNWGNNPPKPCSWRAE